MFQVPLQGQAFLGVQHRTCCMPLQQPSHLVGMQENQATSDVHGKGLAVPAVAGMLSGCSRSRR